MSLMDRCPVKDCTNLKPIDSANCGCHGKPCSTPGCEGTRENGRTVCRRCRAIREMGNGNIPQPKKSLDRDPIFPGDKYSRHSKERDDDAMFTPWKPRPKAKPLMTDAEQRKIDADVHRKLHEKCGYGNGHVKRYTAAEIAAIAGEITHISKVKRCSFGDPINVYRYI